MGCKNSFVRIGKIFLLTALEFLNQYLPQVNGSLFSTQELKIQQFEKCFNRGKCIDYLLNFCRNVVRKCFYVRITGTLCVPYFYNLDNNVVMFVHKGPNHPAPSKMLSLTLIYTHRRLYLALPSLTVLLLPAAN